MIRDSEKLYVGNISFKVTESDLREYVTEMGYTVRDVVIPVDKLTGRSKGYGFVELNKPDQLEKAMEAINGMIFEGRELKVNRAHPRKPRT